MLRYTWKRILTGIFSLFVLVTVTFFLVRIIPGSPFQRGGVSEQVVETIEQEYDLNEPIMAQYFSYLGNVVRCFEDSNIVHVDGSIDPLRDIETINLELVFSDLEILERRIAKTTKVARNDKTAAKELKLLEKIKEHLEDGKLAKSFDGAEDEEEQAWLESYNLLTYKPVIFAANVAEDDLADDGAANAGVQAVREYADKEGCEVFVVCAQIEQEIAELDDDEKKMFLEDLGLSESGLEKLIKASYRLLGLISYLTAGEPEVRAWTIKNGTKAPQAAGKIHSDFERGFIRAEVVAYDDLIACGSHNAAKEKGLVRLEGKDYVVKDGDIMLFRFNV